MNEVELYNYMQNKAKKTNELFQVEIDVTSRCNACCPFCFQGEHLAQDDELSFDSMIVLLDKLREMGTYYIGFSGGEPFIREDFVDILEAAKKRGFRLSLITNGTALNREMINRMKKMKVDHITVSFHSIDPEEYKRCFGIDNDEYYTKALKNIKYMLEVNLSVGIAMTITKDNIDSVEKTMRYFVDIGIPAGNINYNMLLKGNKEIDYLYPSQSQIKAHKEVLTSQSKKQGPRKSLLCSAGTISCSIDSKGNVYPCTFFNSSAGNIKEKSLDKIWKEAHLLKILRGLKEEMFGKCSTCDIFGKCSFCIANNLNQTGSIFEPDQAFCDSRRAKEEV